MAAAPGERIELDLVLFCVCKVLDWGAPQPDLGTLILVAAEENGNEMSLAGSCRTGASARPVRNPLRTLVGCPGPSPCGNPTRIRPGTLRTSG